MKLLSLGHSCYLLEMTPRGGGEPVRILADPWLSDHVIGDLQGRFPRVRLDPARLQPLQGIYLSHSHTDHLDPYSLLSLWRQLDPRPRLIVPESLKFLRALLEEFLEGGELIFLREEEALDFHGVAVRGFFNPETAATNEDDVMVLVVENGREVFLAESDALLPLYHPLGRERIASLLSGDPIETACFLTTKNEGEATLSMVSARDTEDRRRRLERSLERTYEEINEMYAPLEDLEGDPWLDHRLVRLIGGQGICFPPELGTAWNRVLFPIRVEDRVRMEREVAAQYEYRHAVEEFVPGQVHRLDGGRLAAREPGDLVEILDREEERRFDGRLELFEDFPAAPLSDSPRDRDAQRRCILRCLNERFLPHLIGARNPPVEHLLAASGGEYRIRVRLGTGAANEPVDYRITFERLRFEEVAPGGEPEEQYWASDLEDLLDGRCDEFSTFCRHPLPGRAQRLWLALGLPYLNNDLIEKKLRFHFERAARGESLREWVLSFYGR